MKASKPALSALVQEPPAIAVADVAEAVAAQFGLRGEFGPLVSERDQNFELRATDGGRCVVKVTSQLEDPLATDFQLNALRHLHAAASIRTPRVVTALDGCTAGEISDGGVTYRLRVVTWVEGEQLEMLDMKPTLAERFGRALAELDLALQGFSHPGEHPVLLWDLQRVCELRQLLDRIRDRHERTAVAAAIDDFEANVLPVSGELRAQVIHSDANPENVLLSDAGFGFIDFSDIVRAPLVFELAIGASYLRCFGDDPLRLIAPFVAGYHARLPLESSESELLFDLVRARLATTISLLHWRMSARSGEDAYRRKSQELESDASHFLAALDKFGRENFFTKINSLLRY